MPVSEHEGCVPIYEYEDVCIERDESRAEVERLRDLVADLLDPDPCWYDHNGLCQAHHLHARPCPHERARLLGINAR